MSHPSSYSLSGKKPWVVLVVDKRDEIFRAEDPENDEKQKDAIKYKDRIETDQEQLTQVFQEKIDVIPEVLELKLNEEEKFDLLDKLKTVGGLKQTTNEILNGKFRVNSTVFLAQGMDPETCALICIILGHGGPEYLYCPSEKVPGRSDKLELDKIVEIFNGENCSALKGKPKLFFVQAETISPCKERDGKFSGNTSSVDMQKIPIHADIFKYFSSELAGQTWNSVEKNKKKMSRFVHYLCEEIRNLRPERKEDIQRLVIRMNSKISSFPREERKGLPTRDLLPLATSQLRKELYLSDLLPTPMKN